MSSAVKIERKKRFIDAVNALNIRFVGKEIGRATGYQAGTVSAYLNPDEPELSESFVRKVCEKFGLSFEDIWHGKRPEAIKAQAPPVNHDDKERIIAGKEGEIEALRETIKLLKQQLETNSKLLNQAVLINHARLQTILECQKFLRSQALKSSFEEASQEVDKLYEEILERAVIEGKV